jgi:hypothetical protein
MKQILAAALVLVSTTANAQEIPTVQNVIDAYEAKNKFFMGFVYGTISTNIFHMRLAKKFCYDKITDEKAEKIVINSLKRSKPEVLQSTDTTGVFAAATYINFNCNNT